MFRIIQQFFKISPNSFPQRKIIASYSQSDVFLTPRTISDPKFRQNVLDNLKLWKPLRIKAGVPSRKAAVFVPICVVKNEICFLYTLRSTDLRTHRGQVSFPGGMQDSCDKDLEETAVRETCEELGLSKDTIDVWGHGNLVATGRQDIAILPYLGYIGAIDIQTLNLNAAEVECAFTVPIEKLCHPANCRYTQFRKWYVLPMYLGAEHRIWGVTAVITHMMLKSLLPDSYKHPEFVLNSVVPLKFK